MKNLHFAPIFVLLVACASSGPSIQPAPGEKTPATESTPTDATTDAASFCGSLCGVQEACDTSLDTQTCKNSCTNSFAAVFPKLRQDVVGLIVQCFDAKDCKTVLGGDVVGACAEEAVASVAPSDTAASYCDGLVAAKKKCGTTVSKATCLDQAKLYSDDTIGEAANCSERACSEIDKCVSATFGSFGGTTTSTTTTNSGGSCNGQFSDLGSCESCAETSCCAEAEACAKDSTCRSYMAYCQEGGSGSYTSCTQALSSTPTQTRQLLGAYYNCAQTKCGSQCGFIQQ